MQTLFPVIAAGFIGGSLFIMLQPVLVRLVAAFIEHSKYLGPIQKRRLMAILQPSSSPDPRGDWVLLALYMVSLTTEIFFLSISDAGSARAILVGMFLMLFIRSFRHALQMEGSPTRH